MDHVLGGIDVVMEMDAIGRLGGVRVGGDVVSLGVGASRAVNQEYEWGKSSTWHCTAYTPLRTKI